MAWYDHEPREGWDASFVRQPDGFIIDSKFYSWSDLGVVPDAKLRRVERERDAVKAKLPKKQEAAEAKRKARLEKLRGLTASFVTSTTSHWFFIDGTWQWRSWDAQKSAFVDTGLRPGKRGRQFPPDEVQVCRFCGGYE
jgi:hypothetical protein